LPTGHPFSGVQLTFYWSSTTRAVSPGFAWGVFLRDGLTSASGKDNANLVWPVRGGQ
jgi:hypothetical protein